MKRLFVTLILIAYLGISNAQDNSAFVDSVLTLVSKDRIDVYGANLEQLSTASVEIATTDTLVDCVWSRPKFVNNIYYPGMDGFVQKTPVIFDTMTSDKHKIYLEFRTEKYNDNGEFISNDVVFMIEKNGNVIRPDLKFKSDKKELKNTTWKNKQIVNRGENIKFDNCHYSYRLVLHGDFTFEQYYEGLGNKCSTIEMENDVSVGMEGSLKKFNKYSNKLEGHYIDLSEGNWNFENGNLTLYDESGMEVILLKVLDFNNDELKLSVKNNDYIIEMKRANP